MTIKDVDRTKLSPMMSQYIEVKEANLDTIIFFRVGDFYEMFFEDAILAARLLELTLTGKSAGLEDRVPMCGVPHHAYLVYAKKLVDLGYKVGICEQLQNPNEVKGIVKRDIVQILSKGTILNEESLIANDNNYIGLLTDLGYLYLISYCDLSTGQTYVTSVEHEKLKLINEIKNIGLKEVLILKDFDLEITNVLKNQYQLVVNFINKVAADLNYSIYSNVETNPLYKDIRESFNNLMGYLIETQKKELTHLQNIKYLNDKEYLKMDIYTTRNLELVENIRSKERTFSLLWLLDNTKTSLGARLLKRWIEKPSVNIETLNTRYDIISKMHDNFIETQDVRNYLKQVYDIERLSTRIAFDTANAKDMLQLKNTLVVLPLLEDSIEKIGFKEKLYDFSNITKLLEESIYEEPPVSLKEGYLIKEGYNKELDELKYIRNNSKSYLLKLEEEERQRTGIKTLKVAYNRVFGYYIEITNSNTHLVKEEFGYIRKQTLANAERYITSQLKELEDKILSAEDKIINLEYELFIDIRSKVKDYISHLQKAANIIAYVDVMASLAYISEKNKYTRPILTTSKELKLISSRHPVVEKVLKENYVENDIEFNSNTNILLITGPNMAGKSTYMRQLGIIVVMAQIGCFVPATKATLPIFDKIFTRIGASDDLVSGESTFMVEMMEANNALSNCSDNSLLLFDELGRGTATYDGMAIARSILEYLANTTKSKVIFSTHYHELTNLEKEIPTLKNIHVSALEEDGKITFLHKVKEGSVDKSYGIHVASLANLPTSLIKRAEQLLIELEQSSKQKSNQTHQLELPLFTKEESKVEKFLTNVNPNNITPLEAITIIIKLKEIMEEK